MVTVQSSRTMHKLHVNQEKIKWIVHTTAKLLRFSFIFVFFLDFLCILGETQHLFAIFYELWFITSSLHLVIILPISLPQFRFFRSFSTSFFFCTWQLLVFMKGQFNVFISRASVILHFILFLAFTTWFLNEWSWTEKKSATSFLP